MSDEQKREPKLVFTGDELSVTEARAAVARYRDCALSKTAREMLLNPPFDEVQGMREVVSIKEKAVLQAGCPFAVSQLQRELGAFESYYLAAKHARDAVWSAHQAGLTDAFLGAMDLLHSILRHGQNSLDMKRRRALARCMRDGLAAYADALIANAEGPAEEEEGEA